MKRMKKFASLLLAVVMVLAMAVSSWAAETDGKITITDTIVGQTYTIYQILDLESYNAETNAYSYKATDAWSEFINRDDVNGKYLNVDDQGYVTWIQKDSKGNDTGAAEFAELAQAYAKGLSANQGTKKAASAEVVFEGLDLGYYLVDSTLGTLCSLNTTKPDVTMKEKNKESTNEKEVEEDSDGNYGKVDDADIGQVVNFKSTITAQAGAENYVFHDKMSAGLTYGSVTGITLNGTTVTDGYSVVTNSLGDGCTFHVVFTQDFCDTLKANDEIVVSYTATVNSNANVGGEGNDNESHLEYGEESKTTHTPGSTTKTYTWEFDILKYANGNKEERLADAKFVLLNQAKNQVATIENGKITGWTDVPTAAEGAEITWPENTVLTTVKENNLVIQGLDADTYYLREIAAPAGYNKLADDTTVEIKAAAAEDGLTMTQEKATAEINNQSGTELPSTGGMGTTIFYVVGSVLLVGAAVLLITKKRMGNTN